MERFFYQVGIFGEKPEEIIDLLLHRYGGNIDFVLKLPPEDAVSIVNTAILKQAEDRLWQLYTIKSLFAGKDYPAFEDVMKQARKASISQSITWEEAEQAADRAYEAFQKKRQVR